MIDPQGRFLSGDKREGTVAEYHTMGSPGGFVGLQHWANDCWEVEMGMSVILHCRKHLSALSQQFKFKCLRVKLLN